MLMRWMSPDPMAIHAGVGDPYAYVGGKTFRTIDFFSKVAILAAVWSLVEHPLAPPVERCSY